MESLIKDLNQSLDNTLNKIKRTNKSDIERIELNNHFKRMEVRELYFIEYLKQETHKLI
jgi:hypothetical protein